MEPCDESFIQACREHLAVEGVILLIQGHDLVVVLNMHHRIYHACIKVEVQNSKPFWDQRHLDCFGEGRSIYFPYGFFKPKRLNKVWVHSQLDEMNLVDAHHVGYHWSRWMIVGCWRCLNADVLYLFLHLPIALIFLLQRLFTSLELPLSMNWLYASCWQQRC